MLANAGGVTITTMKLKAQFAVNVSVRRRYEVDVLPDRVPALEIALSVRTSCRDGICGRSNRQWRNLYMPD